MKTEIKRVVKPFFLPVTAEVTYSILLQWSCFSGRYTKTSRTHGNKTWIDNCHSDGCCCYLYAVSIDSTLFGMSSVQRRWKGEEVKTRTKKWTFKIQSIFTSPYFVFVFHSTFPAAQRVQNEQPSKLSLHCFIPHSQCKVRHKKKFFKLYFIAGC